MNDTLYDDEFKGKYFSLRAKLAEEDKAKLDELINNAVSRAMEIGADIGMKSAVEKIKEKVEDREGRENEH